MPYLIGHYRADFSRQIKGQYILRTFEAYGLISAPLGTLTIEMSFDIAVPHMDAVNTNDHISKTLQVVRDVTADEASTLFTRFKVLNRDIATMTHGEWAPNKIERIRLY